MKYSKELKNILGTCEVFIFVNIILKILMYLYKYIKFIKYISIYFFFIANSLVSKLLCYNGDGLLKSLINIHGIPINIVKRLIIDFVIAAGDTVRFYKLIIIIVNII